MNAVTSPKDEPNQQTNLGMVATRGTFWVVAEAITSKLLSLTAAWAVSWLLTEADYGLAALAANMMTFFFLSNPMALTDLLTARSRRFRHWIRAGTILCFIAGTASYFFMILIGPVAGWVYENKGSGGPLLFTALLGVASVRFLCDTWAAVPQTMLRVDFRFRMLAGAQVVVNVVLAVSSIVLAFAGAGAYAIVGGASIAALFRMCALWYVSRIRRKDFERSPSPRLLVGNFGLVNASQYLNNASFSAAVLVLGLFQDTKVVGLYNFAFLLSYQINVILAYNFATVLQPVFGILQGQIERQVDAFVRATGVIVAVAVPVCLVQGALSEPLLRFAFAPKWMPALVPLMILSVAQAVSIAQSSCLSLIKAQRRFRAFFYWQLGQTILYIGVLFFLCAVDGVRGASIAMLVQWALFMPVLIWLAVRPAPHRGWREVGKIVASPFLGGAAVAVAVWWLSSFFPPTRVGGALAIIVLGPSAILVYIGILRVIDPKRLRNIIGGLRRSRSNSRPPGEAADASGS